VVFAFPQNLISREEKSIMDVFHLETLAFYIKLTFLTEVSFFNGTQTAPIF
jgi:hypothetical protein